MTAIEEGITFILSHFQEPIFPRRIFTPIQKQIKIDNTDEILKYFKESKFYDCAGKEMEAATCENEHSLNKEQSVYNDLLDGLRFACSEYKIT